MIQFTVYRKQNKIHAFELSGHANSVSEGFDLVCAGVSAVSFGAVNAIIRLCELEPLIEQAGEEGGYLCFELPEDTEDAVLEKAQLLLEGMKVSLETIEREYGSYIVIHEK